MQPKPQRQGRREKRKDLGPKLGYGEDRGDWRPDGGHRDPSQWWTFFSFSLSIFKNLNTRSKNKTYHHNHF